MLHRKGASPVLSRVRSLCISLALLSLLTACSLIPRETFTAGEQAIAEVPGFPGVRFWADAGPAEFQAFALRADTAAAIRQNGGRLNILAISGGAYDGAYGAGIVCGWTAAGTRPEFTIVTGVSAGALIAPLAFAGPDYDGELREAFTGGVANVLGDTGSVLSLLGTSDLRRETLSGLVERVVDERLLAVIAAQYARGRRLLVVTTNLDAQRAVVWDMGAIAASRNSDAPKLFRDILIASASIPGIFAPTLIEVEAKGHRFREMHVDGGAATQVFIVPDTVLINGNAVDRQRRVATNVWVIVNNQLTPQFEVTESGLLSTAGRSFSTLIKSSAKATLLSTADYVGNRGFNLTYIDSDFPRSLKANFGDAVEAGFNAPYMNALFTYGYDKAAGRDTAWTHTVPLPDASVHLKGPGT